MPLASARRALADSLRRPDHRIAGCRRRVWSTRSSTASSPTGSSARTSTSIALPSHRPADREEDPLVQRVVEAISSDPAQPPTVRDLVSQGIGRDAIDAAARGGLVVRVAPDLVFLPAVIERAEAIVAAGGERGHHGERLPRGPRDQPEVRRADPRVVRPERAHAPGRRPAIPAVGVLRSLISSISPLGAGSSFRRSRHAAV